jgi:ferredoxin
MAKLGNRRAANAAGDFYVDSSCIGCGTCRWVASESFDACGGKSRIYSQPGDEALNHRG